MAVLCRHSPAPASRWQGSRRRVDAIGTRPRPCLGRAAGARLTLRHALPINRHCWPCMFMQRETAGECPEWQRGRTVNPLAYAFVGSSPTSPTTLFQKDNLTFLAGENPAYFLSHVAKI